MEYVIRDREADLDAPLGGKARALAALRLADLSIPAWFVVQPGAYHDSSNGDVVQPSPALVAEIAAAVA